MVNKLQRISERVVKLEAPLASDRRVTSKGGLALAQLLARRVRLPRAAERLLPARKDPTQGFPTAAVVLSLIHGLLSGGRGFSATEALRADEPLLRMLGLERAPSAETVEHVVKYLGLECDAGGQAAGRLLSSNAVALIKRTGHTQLKCEGGFVPVWTDGSLLEVEGKNFDSIKVKDNRRGQMCVGAFCGPYLTGMDFALEGQGELTVGRALIQRTVEEVLRPCKLIKRTLLLLDSLYGDGPTLDDVESIPERPAYIAGAQKLETAQRTMAELPELVWRDTGPNRRRGWEASAVATAWVQCREWPEKRQMVCRRWRKQGELFWNYAAVITNLTEHHPRIEQLMRKHHACFEEVIWSLYSHKQAMENQWKDLLEDLGLHHPPCAKARVNAIFYALAGLAYNLSVGVRLLGLAGEDRRLRLWRLRREWFDLAGYVVRHGRRVIVRLLAASDARIAQMLAAMGRLARC